MSVTAASLAAAAFGAGDFLGDVAARGSDWRHVVSVALGAGLLMLGVAAYFGGDHAGTLPLTWCMSAGVGFAVGVSLLYRALAEGRMTQVAPITAVIAIVVPTFVDILAGKAVTGHLILGLGAAGLSTALLSGLSGGWRIRLKWRLARQHPDPVGDHCRCRSRTRLGPVLHRPRQSRGGRGRHPGTFACPCHRVRRDGRRGLETPK